MSKKAWTDKEFEAIMASISGEKEDEATRQSQIKAITETFGCKESEVLLHSEKVVNAKKKKPKKRDNAQPSDEKLTLCRLIRNIFFASIMVYTLAGWMIPQLDKKIWVGFSYGAIFTGVALVSEIGAAHEEIREELEESKGGEGGAEYFKKKAMNNAEWLNKAEKEDIIEYMKREYFVEEG